VLPVVACDRKAPEGLPVAHANPIRMRLRAVLRVPRVARFGQCIEDADVPIRLRAAMPANRDAEPLERGAGAAQVIGQRRRAERRQDRMIVRVAGDLRSGIGDRGDELRRVEREPRDDVVRRADAVTLLDFEYAWDAVDFARRRAGTGIISLDVVERRDDQVLAAGQRGGLARRLPRKIESAQRPADSLEAPVELVACQFTAPCRSSPGLVLAACSFSCSVWLSSAAAPDAIDMPATRPLVQTSSDHGSSGALAGLFALSRPFPPSVRERATLRRALQDLETTRRRRSTTVETRTGTRCFDEYCDATYTFDM